VASWRAIGASINIREVLLGGLDRLLAGCVIAKIDSVDRFR
jgi:hypothetical protein